MRSERSIEVESGFGDIKYNMQHRRFVLRERKKVYIEFGLLAKSHNLRKGRKQKAKTLLTQPRPIRPCEQPINPHRNQKNQTNIFLQRTHQIAGATTDIRPGSCVSGGAPADLKYTGQHCPTRFSNAKMRQNLFARKTGTR